ncbi:MAG: hypothetical protein WDN25_28625 [Acetobacteraceae bacterium]
MMTHLRVVLGGFDNAEFRKLCDSHGLQLVARRPVGLVASTETLELLRGIATIALPFGKVLVAWLNGRASRRVMIQTKDGRIVQTMGMSAEDTAKILHEAASVTVIAPKQDNYRAK